MTAIFELHLPSETLAADELADITGLLGTAQSSNQVTGYENNSDSDSTADKTALRERETMIKSRLGGSGMVEDSARRKAIR